MAGKTEQTITPIIVDNENVANEVAVFSEQNGGFRDIASIVDGLFEGKSRTVTSLTGSDRATLDAVFKATTESESIKDTYLNKPIDLVNFSVTVIEFTDEKTSEVQQAPRIVLIDSEGVARHVTSPVVLGGLQDLLALYGHPSTWTEPVRVKVVSQKSGQYSYLKLVAA